MADEIYEITYSTQGGGYGIIRLNCEEPQFKETLRLIEQNLADTHAKNIVYNRRLRKADDFPVDKVDTEQLSLLTE